jgi:hypothetical protein
LRNIERAAAGPLEQAVESSVGADAIATWVRLSRAGSGAVRELQNGVAHAGGLPSRRDVDALTTRLGRLERRIEELTVRLEDRRD